MNFAKKYQNIKNLVSNELSIIERRMISPINIREPLKAHVIQFLTLPSKRVRSVISILYLKACSFPISEEQLELLAAIEIIHSASLIHDDIIDDCNIRRGHKTISAEFDNKIGVISGDYLLAIAMEKLGNLNSIEILNKFSKTFKQMCIGEINQNFDKFKIGTIENYIEKSKNKTGYLFETALVCCLILFNEEYHTKMAGEFALNLGIAFQIRDDLLNLLSDDGTKPDNNDIKEGIYNAPVIYSGNAQDYTSGIEKTRSLLNNYVEAAEKLLFSFEDNKYTTALKEFLELLKNV